MWIFPSLGAIGKPFIYKNLLPLVHTPVCLWKYTHQVTNLCMYGCPSYLSSFLNLLTRCMSFGIIIMCLVWIATRHANSNRPTKYASMACWMAIITMACQQGQTYNHWKFLLSGIVVGVSLLGAPCSSGTF